MRSQLAKYYVQSLMRDAERIFFVYGMRRSGNHACIGWLVNALEQRAAPIIESTIQCNFNFSDGGKTVFINDVSGMSGRVYLNTLHRHAKQLRQAKFIIISVEDEDVSYADGWRIPKRSEPILVRREILNLMASRFQNINRRAREGWGANLQSMRNKFFTTLKANIKSPRGAIWEFERWSDDETWRQQFLQRLALSHDITPPVSPPGLGSSFSGTQTTPSANQLGKRFMTVEPWDAWVTFLERAVAEHPDLFGTQELDMIQAIRNN